MHHRSLAFLSSLLLAASGCFAAAQPGRSSGPPPPDRAYQPPDQGPNRDHDHDHRQPPPNDQPAQTDAPTSPPPNQPRESPQSRPGYGWIPGYYRWLNGAYSWVPGRLEAGHSGEHYESGEWTLRGNIFVYNSGYWAPNVQAQAGGAPTSPPPAQPNERPQSKPGFGWIPGYYRWLEGRYIWVPGRLEQGHEGERYEPGEWTLRGNIFVYNSGAWVGSGRPAPAPQPGGAGPSSPPPSPPREDRPRNRADYVWARGHYEWQENRYIWVAGHWERERAGKRWNDARWEHRGSAWILVEGTWR